jgi:hypothetical protein
MYLLLVCLHKRHKESVCIGMIAHGDIIDDLLSTDGAEQL